MNRSKSHYRQSSQSSASSGGSKKEKKKRKAKQQTPQHVCTPVITKQPATPPITRLSSPPAEPEGSKEKPREIPPCQTPQQKNISSPHHVRGIPLPQLPPLGESACTIVQVTSPGEFHVHISSEAVGSLRSILAGITHTTHIKATTGDMCLSQFEGDTGWHRVRVEEELSGGKLRVKYLDYGNTELVSASAVAALPEALLGVPALAVRCALEGVEPVGGARAWPMEVSQYFTVLVMERVSFITVKVSLYWTLRLRFCPERALFVPSSDQVGSHPGANETMCIILSTGTAGRQSGSSSSTAGHSEQRRREG